MKREWRNAWFIVRQELGMAKVGFWFTLLFIGYLGVLSFPTLGMAMSEKTNAVGLIVTDFYLLWISSSFGIIINRRGTRYLQEDSYRKFLLKQRTLPIGIRTIVMARYLQLAIIVPINAGVFYTVAYLLSPNLRELMSVGTYISFAMIGVALSVITNSLYNQMEWRLNGKGYLWGVLVYMVIEACIAIIVGLAGGSIFHTFVYVVNTWPLQVAIITIVLIWQFTSLGMKAALMLLRKQDLT